MECSFRYGATEAARIFGVSRATISRWRERDKPYRLVSLESRSRAPKRTRAVRWTWLDEQGTLQLRTQHPRWGKRQLLPLLRRLGRTLSEATIGRILARLKASGRLREPRAVHLRRPRPQRP